MPYKTDHINVLEVTRVSIKPKGKREFTFACDHLRNRKASKPKFLKNTYAVAYVGVKYCDITELKADFFCVLVNRIELTVALVVKSPPASAGDVRDVGSIPGSGRSPGGGHSNPLQYSCLENPMDRGAWQAAAHRVPKRHN